MDIYISNQLPDRISAIGTIDKSLRLGSSILINSADSKLQKKKSVDLKIHIEIYNIYCI